LIFPLGRRYTGPSDSLNSRMVKSVIDAPDIRRRLTDKTFTSENEDDALNILERAYVSNLKGEVNDDLVNRAIVVDDFDKDFKEIR
jgi:hypothetical protein